jgi:hypothetical protein
LSSGISANILDFLRPQKHVLGYVRRQPAAGLVVAKSRPSKQQAQGGRPAPGIAPVPTVETRQ